MFISHKAFNSLLRIWIPLIFRELVKSVLLDSIPFPLTTLAFSHTDYSLALLCGVTDIIHTGMTNMMLLSLSLLCLAHLPYTQKCRALSLWSSGQSKFPCAKKSQSPSKSYWDMLWVTLNHTCIYALSKLTLKRREKLELLFHSTECTRFVANRSVILSLHTLRTFLHKSLSGLRKIIEPAWSFYGTLFSVLGKEPQILDLYPKSFRAASFIKYRAKLNKIYWQWNITKSWIMQVFCENFLSTVHHITLK